MQVLLISEPDKEPADPKERKERAAASPEKPGTGKALVAHAIPSIVYGSHRFGVVPEADPNGKTTPQSREAFEIPQGWAMVSRQDDDFDNIITHVVGEYEFSTDVVIVGDRDGKFSGFHGKRYGKTSTGKIFREFLSALKVAAAAAACYAMLCYAMLCYAMLKVLGERQYQLTSQSYRVLLRERCAADQVKWTHFETRCHKGRSDASQHSLPAYMNFLEVQLAAAAEAAEKARLEAEEAAAAAEAAAAKAAVAKKPSRQLEKKASSAASPGVGAEEKEEEKGKALPPLDVRALMRKAFSVYWREEHGMA
jgi:hypothetical protein